mmetsp:Transcript_2803/g.17441  ORF Transcript_2803/g.17441 Transcript_2803/m.17441 type:complete len:103 (+) Transcript_2803:353-661(+)
MRAQHMDLHSADRTAYQSQTDLPCLETVLVAPLGRDSTLKDCRNVLLLEQYSEETQPFLAYQGRALVHLLAETYQVFVVMGGDKANFCWVEKPLFQHLAWRR